jgi:hypothetical protein
VAQHHLAGDLDVDRVDVVEETGGEEAADLEDEPGEDEDGDGAGAPTAGGGLVLRCQLSVLSCQFLVVRFSVSVIGFD